MIITSALLTIFFLICNTLPGLPLNIEYKTTTDVVNSHSVYRVQMKSKVFSCGWIFVKGHYCKNLQYIYGLKPAETAVRICFKPQQKKKKIPKQMNVGPKKEKKNQQIWICTHLHRAAARQVVLYTHPHTRSFSQSNQVHFRCVFWRMTIIPIYTHTYTGKQNKNE